MNNSNFCNVVLPIIQTETINMKQLVMPKVNYTYFRQHQLTEQSQEYNIINESKINYQKIR